MADRYATHKHPAVKSGRLSEEEAAIAFLHPWRATPAMLDEEVTLKEFADRCDALHEPEPEP